MHVISWADHTKFTFHFLRRDKPPAPPLKTPLAIKARGPDKMLTEKANNIPWQCCNLVLAALLNTEDANDGIKATMREPRMSLDTRNGNALLKRHKDLWGDMSLATRDRSQNISTNPTNLHQISTKINNTHTYTSQKIATHLTNSNTFQQRSNKSQ
jgi:hypothetical protein